MSLIKTWVTTKKGNQFEIPLPAKKIICWQCDGTGTHVNPAIDGHGLSPRDFDEDPNFAENYFAGHYDIQCEECKGERVILELDWDSLSEKMKIRVHKADLEERAHQSEMAMERRLGC